MITHFKTATRESQCRLSLLFLTIVLLTSMLCTGATAAAEAVKLKAVTTVFEPLAQHNSYQPLPKQSIAMPELSNWQDANSRVKDLGGWMFYASEGDAGTDHTKQHSPHQHHSEKQQPATPVKDQP